MPEKNRQIVDKNDVVLGAKLDHTVDFSRDIYRVSVLWLLNSKSEVLIAMRSPKKKNHGGLWGPSVAGTVENTETYLQNIVKESAEEIGLTDVEFVAGKKMYFDVPRKHFTQYFFAMCDKNANDFELEDEVDSVKWVSKDWLTEDVARHPECYLPHMDRVVKEVLL